MCFLSNYLFHFYSSAIAATLPRFNPCRCFPPNNKGNIICLRFKDNYFYLLSHL